MNTIKKSIFTAMLLCGAFQAWGVPAFPGFMTVMQSDGTELSVRRVGDEYGHLILTSDGYPLLFNTVTRNYEFAVLSDDNLKSSGIMASEIGCRDMVAERLLATVDRESVMEAFGRSREAAMKVSGNAVYSDGPRRIMKGSDVPTTGKHDVLVILVDFKDLHFSDNAGTPDPKEYYDRFFHQNGFSDFGARGSAHDYYYEGSCGLYDPQFRVLGPVEVAGSYKDYAGPNGSENTYRMIQEAVRLADEQYDVDFRDFDTDGDGKVDNVYCLYAGYGRADSGESESIWPHSYELANRDATFLVDNVVVDRYTVSQQVNGQTHEPVGIGTFVHEFGHVLGFADHYNNSSKLGNPVNNVGQWDLMASGSYNDNQNCPPTLSAFERYSLGWTEPVELDVTTEGFVEMTSYMETGQCFRVSVSEGDREYFLIENRQQTGWDEHLPGHGILVWHIEEDKQKWEQNKPNFDQNHQCVDIVEAGKMFTSTGSPSDPFPGAMNITSYNFQAWDSRSVFGFDWVEEMEGGTCRFLLSNTGFRIPSPEVEIADLMGTTATIVWKDCDLADSYLVTLLRDGEEIMREIFDASGSMPLSGLEAETEYTARVVAMLKTLRSEETDVKFTTLPLQIEEKCITALPAADVTDSGFTAVWNMMPEATDYIVSLYTATHDGEGVFTHGFDDFSSSNPRLPEGWSVTEKQGRNENDFGVSAPSIRLRDDNSVLAVAMPGEKLDSVSLWLYPNKAGLIVTAERCEGGEWSEVWRHVSERKEVLTPVIDVCGADSVRLNLTREEGVTGGFVLIDDVTLHYVYDRFSFDREVVAGPSGDVPFICYGNGVCVLPVDGLEPSVVYGYDVTGMNGHRRSGVSAIIKVEDNGISGINRVGDDSRPSSVEIYNLQGLRVRGDLGSLPAGIYIVDGKKVVVR